MFVILVTWIDIGTESFRLKFDHIDIKAVMMTTCLNQIVSKQYHCAE